MREIKFRGKKFGTAQPIYFRNLLWSPDVPDGAYYTFDCGCFYKVYQVEQFIGVDKNGREVYEGDTLMNPTDGTLFKAAMNHIYTVKSYELQEKES